MSDLPPWDARRKAGLVLGSAGTLAAMAACARSIRFAPAWMVILFTLPLTLLAGAVVWAFVARGPSAFSGLRLFGPRPHDGPRQRDGSGNADADGEDGGRSRPSAGEE